MKKLTISEIVFITVISAALGVFWWGYTFFYDLLKPFLKPIAAENLLGGIWLMGAIFFPFIIRKPGSAFLGELVAATVEGLIARWGISAVFYGLAQGVPVEIFFLLLKYKKWDTKTVAFAGAISALSSYTLTFFWYKYYTLALWYNIVQVITFIISGAILGGIFSKFLANALKQTGVLNQFEFVREDFE